jgi:hypothetical protein
MGVTTRLIRPRCIAKLRSEVGIRAGTAGVPHVTTINSQLKIVNWFARVIRDRRVPSGMTVARPRRRGTEYDGLG